MPAYAQLLVAASVHGVAWEAGSMFADEEHALMVSPDVLAEHVQAGIAFQAGRGGGMMILPLATITRL